MQKIKELKNKYSKYTNLQQDLDNLIEMNTLLLTESDEEIARDILRDTKKLEKDLDKLEIETLLSR